MSRLRSLLARLFAPRPPSDLAARVEALERAERLRTQREVENRRR